MRKYVLWPRLLAAGAISAMAALNLVDGFVEHTLTYARLITWLFLIAIGILLVGVFITDAESTKLSNHKITELQHEIDTRRLLIAQLYERLKTKK